MGTIILIYLTLRVRQIGDGSIHYWWVLHFHPLWCLIFLLWPSLSLRLLLEFSFPFLFFCFNFKPPFWVVLFSSLYIDEFEFIVLLIAIQYCTSHATTVSRTWGEPYTSLAKPENSHPGTWGRIFTSIISQAPNHGFKSFVYKFSCCSGAFFDSWITWNFNAWSNCQKCTRTRVQRNLDTEDLRPEGVKLRAANGFSKPMPNFELLECRNTQNYLVKKDCGPSREVDILRFAGANFCAKDMIQQSYSNFLAKKWG